MIYTKEIYTLMNYLSDIGGLFNSLFVGGKLVMMMFLEKLFYSSILNKIYYSDKKSARNEKW